MMIITKVIKAHLYDKERIKYKDIVVVNFYKDFNTQKYQATFGFNQEVKLLDKEKFINATALKLVYLDDFRLVFQDLTHSMYQISSKKTLNLDLLSFENIEISHTIYVTAPPEEELPVINEKDGQWLLVLSDKARLEKIAPNLELYDDDNKPKE